MPTDNYAAFLNFVNNKLKFSAYLLFKLPSAWLCGVRVEEISTEKAVVTVPFKWLSQNPFKSTYFACLAMAAELSTGILAMGYTYKSDPTISMLVTGMQATFIKKAAKKVYFICANGLDFSNAVATAKTTGEAVILTARSLGKTKSGETIAEFEITWSFKARTKR